MIPAKLAAQVRDVHGPRGERWLEELPALLAECERRWSLEIGAPFADLSYNYVAPARRAQAQVVLKLGVPHAGLSSEIAALEAFDGAGAVRLLEADRERGALLLERLVPGTPLSALADDDEATAIAARVMRTLWREAPALHAFPTVADWARGLERLRARHRGTSGPLPEPLVAAAEAVFAASTRRATKLLHGDLHSANILASGAGSWLAIDPKGVLGDPAYEVGAWLCNPAGVTAGAGVRDQLARRLVIFSRELSIERESLRRAAFGFAMLSACWSLEDHGGGFESALEVARQLQTLAP